MIARDQGKKTSGLVKKMLQHKFRSHIERSTELLARSDYSSFPVAALVDVTSKCNLNCSWCIDGDFLNEGEISTERALSLLDELKEAGIKSIVYFGGGEPLVHPGFLPIIQKTAGLGIDYALNTNGVLLKGRLQQEIAHTAQYTRVSLDSGNEQQYKELHNNQSHFAVITRNMESYNKYKKGTLGISYIIMEENISGIVECTQMAKAIGCDFIQFKPKYDLLDKGSRLINRYQEDLVKSVEEELHKAKMLEEDGFSVLTTGSLNLIVEGEAAQVKSYHHCYAQQDVVLINPKAMYVCPNWRGAEDKAIGDITKDSFKDIWLSDQRKQVITRLDPSKECRVTCLRHETNTLMNAIVESKKMAFNLLDFIHEIDDDQISDSNFI